MRKSQLKRSGAPKKTNPARRRKEFARTLHSKARQKFVQSLPCSACGVVGYSVNAHLLGNGGMSRKGDYDTVGPLCGPHRIYEDTGFATVPRFFVGCHNLYDEARWLFDKRSPAFDPERVARETEELFREHTPNG